MLPELFAAVDVGYMHLDGRHFAGQKGIEQGNRRRRIARRIDHDPSRSAAAFLHPGDEFAFAVGLAKIDGKAQRLRDFSAKLLDIIKGRAAVDMRLAQTKHVDIRTVQDRDQRPGFGLGHEMLRSIGLRGGPTAQATFTCRMPMGMAPGRGAVARWRRPPHTRGMQGPVTLTLNGETRVFETPAGGTLSVLGMLTQLELDARKVAVERNEEIVPRSRYGETVLANGDVMEIVHFIGGG